MVGSTFPTDTRSRHREGEPFNREMVAFTCTYLPGKRQDKLVVMMQPFKNALSLLSVGGVQGLGKAGRSCGEQARKK